MGVLDILIKGQRKYKITFSTPELTERDMEWLKEKELTLRHRFCETLIAAYPEVFNMVDDQLELKKPNVKLVPQLPETSLTRIREVVAGKGSKSRYIGVKFESDDKTWYWISINKNFMNYFKLMRIEAPKQDDYEKAGYCL